MNVHEKRAEVLQCVAHVPTRDNACVRDNAC
jgi:hypothetical protein